MKTRWMIIPTVVALLGMIVVFVVGYLTYGIWAGFFVSILFGVISLILLIWAAIMDGEDNTHV